MLPTNPQHEGKPSGQEGGARGPGTRSGLDQSPAAGASSVASHWSPGASPSTWSHWSKALDQQLAAAVDPVVFEPMKPAHKSYGSEKVLHSKT